MKRLDLKSLIETYFYVNCTAVWTYIVNYVDIFNLYNKELHKHYTYLRFKDICIVWSESYRYFQL
jgi:hypothetical protein